MTTPNDPRPLYAAAHQWCLDLVADLRPEELDAPTPCPDWDVRTVVAHLIGSVDRARVVAQGAAPFSVPTVVAGIPDDALAERYAAALAQCAQVWADDSVLDRELTAPWGTVTGRGALLTWAKEPLVHGWDLAVSTGRPAEAPADLVTPALADAEHAFPRAARGGPIPFGPPVDPADGAGPNERLANWLGHHR